LGCERAYAQKRNEILDVAKRLVFAKGYERMRIRNILAELKIFSNDSILRDPVAEEAVRQIDYDYQNLNVKMILDCLL